MEHSKILQADYLDLLFDNRNKKYGGYELRKHYNRRALKALGITFSLFLLAAGTPFVVSKLNAKDTLAAATPPEVITDLTDIVLPPLPPDAPPPPPKLPDAAPPPAAKTVIFTEPKIEKPDANPDKPLPDMKELENAKAGPVNHEGEGGETAATSTEKHTGPFGNGTSGEEKKGGGLPVFDEPVDFTDVMPEYPGGMAALLAFLQSHINYPAAAREEGIQGKVVVKFIVNREGEIENAQVVKSIGGGCDREALRVVNAMPKWKPGKQKGRAVKVYYTLPVTFKLQ